MAQLGINVPGGDQMAASDIAATGVRWARCVADPHFNIAPRIQELQQRAIRTVLIITSTSLEREGGGHRTPAEAADFFRGRYGSLTGGDFGLVFQVGNEADANWDRGNQFSAEKRRQDHPGSPSWMMDPVELSGLFKTFRDAMPGVELWSAGLCSGDPEYASLLDLGPVDRVAVHAYLKTPDNVVDFVFGDHAGFSFAQFGKPLVVTEFGCPSALTLESEAAQADYYASMAQVLKEQPDLGVAILFCYENAMNPGQGMGLVDGPRVKPAFEAFRKVCG